MKKSKQKIEKKTSKALLKDLETLFEFAAPQSMSRNLRNIFLSYISHERDILPLDIEEIILQMNLLLEFLDEAAAQQEMKK
ncbi:MAG: hypothetical protein JWO58_605 [Chitinophagaceae bacterium]|nr:hypothetical protein [Chitinophagaceae bacterium]